MVIFNSYFDITRVYLCMCTHKVSISSPLGSRVLERVVRDLQTWTNAPIVGLRSSKTPRFWHKRILNVRITFGELRWSPFFSSLATHVFPGRIGTIRLETRIFLEHPLPYVHNTFLMPNWWKLRQDLRAMPKTFVPKDVQIVHCGVA